MMNAYTRAVFELGAEVMRLQRAEAMQGKLPAAHANLERHAHELDELRTEGFAPSPRLSELPNPHDD